MPPSIRDTENHSTMPPDSPRPEDAQLPRGSWPQSEPCGESTLHAAADTFDLLRFIQGAQPLNPLNPHHAQVAPLHSDSLRHYYQLGMASRSEKTGNAAQILGMSEAEFQQLDAVKGYIAHEMERGTNAVAEGNACTTAPGVPEATDMDPAIELPYSAAHSAESTPASYLWWLGTCHTPAASEADSEHQVVLCASNAEDAHPPGWSLG